MRNLETKYAGLTLRNPLIVGSSGLTSKADKNGKYQAQEGITLPRILK